MITDHGSYALFPAVIDICLLFLKKPRLNSASMPIFPQVYHKVEALFCQAGTGDTKPGCDAPVDVLIDCCGKTLLCCDDDCVPVD